mmetsp:Transcript_70451/g.82084  ORF Transcript_70451/g.82084 Transcript_70451/m.82084 type:complete len:300 (+) Transcript_70451:26-925(+)
MYKEISSPILKAGYSPTKSGPERSLSTNVSNYYSNNYSLSNRDLSPMYKDTTFGSAKRMHLPPVMKLDFIVPETTLSKRYIGLPKSPRKQLTEMGLDAPSPSRYDIRHSSEVLKPNRGNYSFSKSNAHLATLDAEGGLSDSVLHKKPGPGEYDIKYRAMGTEGPHYTFKQRIGDYLPNVLKHPPVNKYDPKPTYLKTNLIKDGLGVVRSARDASYILNKKIPGPGDYELHKDGLASPNRFIHGKIDPEHVNSSSLKINTSPGPGTYELVKSYDKYNWDQARLKASNFREMRRNNIVRNF